MTALLVGADKLGNIPDILEDKGFENIIHWTGRKSLSKARKIPLDVDLVLVFHDYVNHILMDSVKAQAKQRKLPVMFSKRGTSVLKKEFEKVF